MKNSNECSTLGKLQEILEWLAIFQILMIPLFLYANPTPEGIAEPLIRAAAIAALGYIAGKIKKFT